MTTTRRLTTVSVLAFLAEAGPGGATTTAIAQAHDYPEAYQQRSNYASAVLARLDNRGHAERTGIERSPLYRGAPVSRWRITDAGQLVLDTAVAREAARTELEARIEQAEQARKTALDDVRAELSALIRDGGMIAVTAEWRAARVRRLRAVPCTLSEIAGVFGVTKERVRQIELFGTSPVR
jgi:hypothetical protein